VRANDRRKKSRCIVMEAEKTTWESLVLILVLACAVWWVWKRAIAKPKVDMQPNATAPPVPPPGIPVTITAKMARVVDPLIPVVMTSGATVPYTEDEVNQIVRSVLGRLNSLDEQVTLIQVVSVSKTQDSYKTVAYDIAMNVYDARENVGMQLLTTVLVPVSGLMYVRQLKLASETADTNAAPRGRDAVEKGGVAVYEDPVAVLSTMDL
jgi:hypothetical protein